MNNKVQPVKKTTKIYVDNKALYENIRDVYYPLVKEWRAEGRPGNPPPITDHMAKAIFLISKNFCLYRKFYHLRHIHDDLASYASLTVMKYIHNFNPDKYDKPFAYITRIVNNAFLQYLKQESKNNKAKTVAAQQMLFDQMMNEDPENSYVELLTGKIESDKMEDERFEKNNEEFKKRHAAE